MPRCDGEHEAGGMAAKESIGGSIVEEAGSTAAEAAGFADAEHTEEGTLPVTGLDTNVTLPPPSLPCGLSARLWGTIISLLGALSLSPDALLLRIVRESGASIWTIHFWRMTFFSAFVTLAFVMVRMSGGTRLDAAFRRAGRVGLLCGALWGIGSTCFTAALSLADVANVLVITASSPLWAALLSWLLLKERIPLYTGVAILIGFGGIAVVLGGEISAPTGDQWKGVLLALASSVCNAGYFVGSRFLKGEMLPSLMIGGIIGALVALMFDTRVGSVPNHLDWLWLWMQGFVVAGIAFSLLSVAPRYIYTASHGLRPPPVCWPVATTSRFRFIIGCT